MQNTPLVLKILESSLRGDAAGVVEHSLVLATVLESQGEDQQARLIRMKLDGNAPSMREQQGGQLEDGVVIGQLHLHPQPPGTEKCVCSNPDCGWIGQRQKGIKFNEAKAGSCPKCRTFASVVVACEKDACWRVADDMYVGKTGVKMLCKQHSSEQFAREIEA